MKTKVFIDGKEGTTGLQIFERFEKRDDLDILLIDEDKRKDSAERAKMINSSDITFLCPARCGGKRSGEPLHKPRC